MGFFKNAFEFVARPTHSRTMGILIFFVLIAAVSLTVYVAQQQQQLRQKAAENPACQSIDNIPDCNFAGSLACETQGKKCKLALTVYECQQ